jgi:hypothetical protein
LKRILLATLAVGMLAVGVPAATAGDDSIYSGGCGLNTATDPSSQVGQEDQFQGQLSVRTTTYDTTPDPGDGPVGATSTCDLYVNTTIVDSVSATGAPVQANAKATSYVKHDSDVVKLCLTVDYADDTETVVVCAEVTTVRIPPQIVSDTLVGVIDTVFGILDPVFTAIDDLLGGIERDQIDPRVCPVLAAHAGSVGPVTIDGQGDVYIDGELFWDCPPYVPPTP